MKIKFIQTALLLLFYSSSFSQYIAVKARYTATRTVDNPGHGPSRENRLILSFFTVDSTLVYTPAHLSNFTIHIYKEGLQYGSQMGGVLDSSGNNYPGYPMTAPKVVSYYNSLGLQFIDCDSTQATAFTVNGSELDCGFIQVSHWETDVNSGADREFFTAPNVCLPYYIWPEPYAVIPGNLNFNWPVIPTAPYNWYSYSCPGSPQQQVIRGVLEGDSTCGGTNNLTGCGSLSVQLANERALIDGQGTISISWTHLTESNVSYYSIERAAEGNSFEEIGKILPHSNNGSRADYTFSDQPVIPGSKVLYRIKAMEDNGSIIYSSVLVVNTPAERTNLSVYPNPVQNDRFSFSVTNLIKGRYEIVLVNAAGEQQVRMEFFHPGGSLTQVIELPPTSAGLYFLLLRSATTLLSKTIIIKK